MLSALRARQPGQPLLRVLWWYFLHLLCVFTVGLRYQYRATGAHHIPRTGAVLFVCNHQSFLDPILVGLSGHRRQFYAMARATLFRNPFFAFLIRSLNAIPVRQGVGDTSAIRTCIKVLKGGHALLVFPEGERTIDGCTHTFAPGTMLLIKRTRPQVVPVAIEGAYNAWPRFRRRPQLRGRIHVRFGKALDAGLLVDMGSAEALKHLENDIETMRRQMAGNLKQMKPGVGFV